MSSQHIPSIRSNRLVIASAGLTATVSALVLLGWAANIQLLKSIIPGLPEMNPATALTFQAVAAALLISALWPDGKWSKRSIAVIGTFVAVFATVSIAAYILGTPSFTDSLFVPEAGRVHGFDGNRMSPHAAVNFLLIGISLTFSYSPKWLARIGVCAALLSLAGGYAAILGHLFGADQFYGVTQVNSMAVHTAVLFSVVATALISSNSKCRPISLIFSDSLGGQAIRRLLPVVIVIPTLVGWLRVLGQEAGFYDTAFGTAMSTFILVLLMFAIILFYSQTVHKSDGQRRAVEADLAENEKRYHELFDYSQGLICIHDLNGVLTTVNRASLQLLGYSEEEMKGRSLSEFMPDEHQPLFQAYIRQVTYEGLAQGLLQLKAKNGKMVTLRFNNVLATESGKDPYVLGHAQDVTELLKAQQELKELSLTDELTGLYNRRGFLTLAEQQLKLERHKRTARGLTLMFADMDGLKKINDTLGHEAGSDAIRTLAHLVRSAVRGGDLVARWGGDEFVILSIGSSNDNVHMISSRITDSLDEYNTSSGKPYIVACSIGLAPVILDAGKTFEDIIAEADEAMYEAKRRRKAGRIETSPPATGLLPISEDFAWY